MYAKKKSIRQIIINANLRFSEMVILVFVMIASETLHIDQMQFNSFFVLWNKLFVSQCHNKSPKRGFKTLGNIFNVWDNARSVVIFKPAKIALVQIN
jgi:hypothetical protein